MGRLFGTDGIRGLAEGELDSTLAYQVGEALAEVLQKSGVIIPRILVGMDTRESSPKLCSALTKGITDGGGKAVSIGVCPTPAVAYHLIKHSFDAGVMISASHNPYKYNGIKIFGGNGFKLSDEAEEKIEEIVLNKNITPDMARKEYIDYLKNSFGVVLNGLKIGIDCANGSASVTAKELFTQLGAECYTLSDNPNGKNINENCGSTHLEELKNLVISLGLDAGIAFDGDADRCIAIDEKGREIDGDYIMAILALQLKKEGKLEKSALVGTVMTNLGLRKFCEDNGIDFKSSAVGDRFVLEMLKDEGLSLGGEQSGHIILPHLATTGDGQLTAIALLSQIKKNGKNLGALAEIMKKYPQITINIEADKADKKAFSEDEIIREIISNADKRIKNNGRIVARVSGTEPLIRITVESSTEDEAHELCNDTAEKIKKRLLELKSAVG